MKKASEYRYLEAFIFTIGRCERIRTFYPLHPMLEKLISTTSSTFHKI